LIGYDRHALSDEVRNEMNSDKFSKLGQLNTAHAIANMYKYKDPVVDHLRDITDDAYMGSLYFYHQQGVLYASGSLRMNPLTGANNYRHVSFVKGCKAGEDEIKVLTYNDVVAASGDTAAIYNPDEASNPDGLTQHLCGMFHDVPVELQKKLQKKNEGITNIGAVIIHVGSDAGSTKLGCGYLKNPDQARIQFLRDHQAEKLPFNPFQPQQPSSPINKVNLLDSSESVQYSFKRLLNKYVAGRAVYKEEDTDKYMYYNEDLATWFVGDAWDPNTLKDSGDIKDREFKSNSNKITSSPPNYWHGKGKDNTVWDIESKYKIKFGGLVLN
jgi:hypothetical protein